jgi:hypothetical protein
MTSRRWSALLLLFALIGGGIGLPVADALVYHSSPVQRSAPVTDDQTLSAPASTLHLQGCVLTLSGMSGSGLAGSSPTVAVATEVAVVAPFAAPLTVLTQTDLTLGQSRAPPIA